MEFSISRSDKQSLFDSAYRQTDEHLGKLDWLVRSRSSAASLRNQLLSQYGSPTLYAPVLNAIVDYFLLKGAKNVRANIMLRTGRQEDGIPTRIVVYQVNMDGDPDSELEMKENAGCSGRAWERRTAAVADLEQAAQNPGLWQMSHDLHAKVPPERKSMFSVPIPGRTGELGSPGDPSTAPIGTLSVDSTTPLDDTSWLRKGVIDPEIATHMTVWAYIVARIIP